MWCVQKSDLEKISGWISVCVCVSFDIIFIEIDSWIGILWRFQLFEKFL